MRRLILVTLIFICAIHPARAQRDDAETTVVESGYSVVPSYGGRYKVVAAIIAANPYEDKFASRPNVRVTARAADGSVIATRDIHSAGIPPKGKIAFIGEIHIEEMPAKVEFRPLAAGYEPTIFKSSDFLPFELIGVRSRDDGYGRVRVTGEVKNPFPGETGVWITFLYRDAAGKLIGGHTKWEHTIPAGDPSPFEMNVDAQGVPPAAKKVEYYVFSHNNYQDSWRKLLRR